MEIEGRSMGARDVRLVADDSQNTPLQLGREEEEVVEGGGSCV